jgi:exoribonuclease R
MDIRRGELITSFKPVIKRSVIRSCAKWHYQLVQDILDKKVTSVDQLEDRFVP